MIYLLTLIPLILVAVWFRNGNLMGAGESGLPFYNLRIASENSHWAWADSLMGGANGINVAAHPTYFVLSKLEGFGVPSFLIQAVFMYLVLVVSGFSIVYLTKILFPRVRTETLIITALFYWFNPFVAVNVWNRFLYNFMSFYALFPLVLALFIQGLRKKDLIYTLYLGLVSVLLSYSFTSTSSVALMLGTLCFTALFWALVNIFKNESPIFPVIYLFATIAVFVLTNFWWIGQTISFVGSSGYDASVDSFFTTSGNYFNLDALSQRLGQFIFTFRYMHADFYTNGLFWTKIMIFPPIILLEFIVSWIVLRPIYENRKEIQIIFLSLLFVISLLFIKGNQPPFGEIFLFFFERFKYLQIFRNPFEKIGFLLVIVSTPLFAIGMENSRKILRWMAYALIIILWGFPYWSGQVFVSKGSMGEDIVYETRVPQYYKEADNWLLENSGDYRFISLPLGGEGITYSWDKPYSGVESSSAIFNTPNISINTSVPYLKETVPIIEKALIRGKGIEKLMPILNAKFIVLRKDIDWKLRGMTNPLILEKLLDENSNFRKVKEFGPLSVYEVEDKFLRQGVLIQQNLIEVNPAPEVSDIYIKENSSLNSVVPKNLGFDISTLILKPVRRSYLEPTKEYTVDGALAALAYARFLPTNPLYPLIITKENMERSFTGGGNSLFVYDLSRLGKRAAEAYGLAINGADRRIIEKSIDDYFVGFESLITSYPLYFRIDHSNEFLNLVSDSLMKHAVLFQGPKDLEDAKLRLDTKLYELGLKTLYPIRFDTNKGMQMYRFIVDTEGEYELIMTKYGYGNFYELLEKEVKVQINDKIMKIFPEGIGDKLSLGKFQLNEGPNEIIIESPNLNNLVNVENEFTLDSESKSSIELEPKYFDAFGRYRLSFDYWIKQGKALDLAISYDNSLNEKAGVSKIDLIADGYNHFFNNYSLIFNPRSGSSKMKIVLRSLPDNICPEKIIYILNSCKNEAFRSMFNKKTEAEIRNVKLERFYDESMFVVRTKDKKEVDLPAIRYVKVNPSEYKVFVSDAQDPYLLELSQLFDSGWTVQPDDGSAVIPSKHFLINGLSNGWVIDRKGDYSFKITYAPQKYLVAGSRISQFSLLSLVLFIGIIKWKKRQS